MSFGLEKWYFDCLSPENDYIFLYLAQARVLTRTEARINLCIFSATKKESIYFSHPVKVIARNSRLPERIIRTEYGDLQPGGETPRINLSIGVTEIELVYQASGQRHTESSPLRIFASKPNFIEWYPICLWAAVSGRIKVNQREWTLRNANGYIDYLCSNIFPPSNPVRTLFWGRLHQENFNITFTLAQGEGESRRWCKLILELEDRVVVIDHFSLHVHGYTFSEALNLDYPRAYEIEGQTGDISINISVHRIGIAIESKFIDQQEFKGRMRRALYLHLAGNPRGLKFISSARVYLKSGLKTYRADAVKFIDEYLKFGKRGKSSQD